MSRENEGLSGPGSGNVVLETGLFFSGQTGFSVVVPVVGEDLEGVGPAELQTGKDIDGQAMDLGKGQEDFFGSSAESVGTRWIR